MKYAVHTLAMSHIFNVLSSDAVTSSLLSLDHATSEIPCKLIKSLTMQ